MLLYLLERKLGLQSDGRGEEESSGRIMLKSDSYLRVFRVTESDDLLDDPEDRHWVLTPARLVVTGDRYVLLRRPLWPPLRPFVPETCDPDFQKHREQVLRAEREARETFEERDGEAAIARVARLQSAKQAREPCRVAPLPWEHATA